MYLFDNLLHTSSPFSSGTDWWTVRAGPLKNLISLLYQLVAISVPLPSSNLRSRLDSLISSSCNSAHFIASKIWGFASFVVALNFKANSFQEFSCPVKVPMSRYFLSSRPVFTPLFWFVFIPSTNAFRASFCCRCSPSRKTAFCRKSSVSCSVVAMLQVVRHSTEGVDQTPGSATMQAHYARIFLEPNTSGAWHSIHGAPHTPHRHRLLSADAVHYS